MIHYTEFRHSTADGTVLFFRYWQPTQAPKAVINFVHGQGDHSARYEEWAKKFCLAGFAWFSFDLRGHGNSSGRRGHINNMGEYLADVDILRQKSFNVFGNLPAVLIGHSMGGNIVLNYASQYKHSYKAVVSSSPWLRLAFVPNPIKTLTLRWLKKIFPSLRSQRGFKIEHLSRDKAVIDFCYQDELAHGKISASAYFSVKKSGLKLLKTKPLVGADLLVMHGTADKITSFEASKEFADNYSGVVTFKSWMGFYHELFKDTDNHLVFSYLLHWIEEKLK